jgi:hypothetical protein
VPPNLPHVCTVSDLCAVWVYAPLLPFCRLTPSSFCHWIISLFWFGFPWISSCLLYDPTECTIKTICACNISLCM